jgi:hypothetical protein
MKKLTTHLRSNVISYAALFFAMSAGAYAAGLAPNSVKSKHIKDGHVANADLAPDAVSGDKVFNSSLSGSDLGENTLGGQHINESSLGEVRNATIAGHGGYGRHAANQSFCSPDSGYETCASVGLTPSAPGRALVIGTVSAFSVDEELGGGNCRLGVSTSGEIPGTLTEVYLSEQGADTITLSGITAPLAPGTYSFGIDCKVHGGDLEFSDAAVTAVMISPF